MNIYPLITKHNRAGKGAGVQLFNDAEALDTYVNSDSFEEPVDGITLLQEYIRPIDGHIRRSEFIGRKFLYTVSTPVRASNFAQQMNANCRTFPILNSRSSTRWTPNSKLTTNAF